MNNRTTSTTEQHERDDGEEMPIGLPRRQKTSLADSIGPHSFNDEKDHMANLMSRRSFNEQTLLRLRIEQNLRSSSTSIGLSLSFGDKQILLDCRAYSSQTFIRLPLRSK